MSFKIFKHYKAFQLRAEKLKELASTLDISRSPQKRVDIYLMNNQNEQFYTGKEHLTVFLGAVPFKSLLETEKRQLVINGHTYDDIPAVIGEGTQDYADFDGTFFISEANIEYYFPWNLAEVESEKQEAIFADVIAVIQAEINELQNKDSWAHSSKKELLQKRIMDYMKRDIKEQLANKRAQNDSRQREIVQYKSRIMDYYRQIQDNMRQIASLENGEVDGLDTFFGGLDSIAKHPMVKDVKVLNDKVEIYTHQIVTRARVERQERFYDMGEMHISINIKSSDVRFFGEKKNRSHWTSKDPHPHVDGNTGRACLGNVDVTIMELCQQLEIYPLFLTALDFLQNANTEDVAGKNVVNWERVNEDGTPWIDEKKLKRDREKAEKLAKIKAEEDARRAREVQDLASLLEAQPAPQTPVSDRVIVATDIEQRINVLKTEVDEVATFIAYPNYIGYVANGFLEQAEEILKNGGNI